MIRQISFILLSIILQSTLSAQSTFQYTKQSVGITLSDASFLNEIPLQDALKVFVGDTIPSPESEIPSILGEVSRTGNNIGFTPIFPFRDAGYYIAVLANGETFPFYFERNIDLPRPKLINIFPSATTIPANQLKIYLFFSEPMRESFAYKYVQIRDQNGEIIENPFVPLQPELWDETQTRLTLWLDPGRVKRGLMSNEAFGEILSPGQKITVEVNVNWSSLVGMPLIKGTSKTYQIGDYDRISPVPDQWTFRPPTTRDQMPIFIEFGESLDRALLIKSFSVLNENDQEIAGDKLIMAEEKGWSFLPREDWKSGNYRVRIDAFLEDLAGNNLNRLFDRDLMQEQAQSEEKDYFYLFFRIE